MKSQVLCADKRYEGKHVVLESFNSRKVVASGSDPVVAISKAREKGYDEAVLVFIPEKDAVFVY